MQSQKEIPLSRLFIHCGILAWCFEILYTSLRMLQRRNYRLQGNTYIWMFPIYGCAAFLRPLNKVMHHFSVFFRGIVYALLIYTGEYFSGKFLDKKQMIPWNYDRARLRICRYIRLDFFPFWFLVGLIFEHFNLHNGFSGIKHAKTHS